MPHLQKPWKIIDKRHFTLNVFNKSANKNCLQSHGLIKSQKIFIFKGIAFWAKVCFFLWNGLTTHRQWLCMEYLLHLQKILRHFLDYFSYYCVLWTFPPSPIPRSFECPNSLIVWQACYSIPYKWFGYSCRHSVGNFSPSLNCLLIAWNSLKHNIFWLYL